MKNDIEVFIKSVSYSEKEKRQLVEAIQAFKEGKEQPQGRFVILETLSKVKE